MTPVLRRLLASVVAAFVVTFITIDANGLAFFIGNGFDFSVVVSATTYFMPSVAFLLLLTVVAGMLGWYAHRRWSWLVGLGAGVVSAFIGAILTVTSQGGSFDVSVWQQIFGSFVGFNLVYVVATTVASVTAGTWVYRRVFAARLSRARRRIALVRAPAASLAEGLVTHIKRKKIDLDVANDQWDGYVSALTSSGWNIVEVAPRDELADSVFVEDTVVMLDGLAVITNPGAVTRKAEIFGTEEAVRGLGLPVERIVEPGTLDGGDVLKVDRTIYVGTGGRTNGEGIRQFRAIATRLGFTVVAVPVSKALHLKSAVTALPDGTVIGHPKLVDAESMFPRFLAVPEPEGVAVVVLESDTLLMSSSAPKSAELIRSLGYRVITVDISEFEKLEGCVTCLSVRIR
ncbi:MAG: dimethylarginine dimethylaminohydrolase [Microbacteriaceae bacterium]|nr:dimethylarginine dimethylaminohydrolase [Microbacteriaceae bacterium]